MYYVIVSEKPFIYLSGNKEEYLKGDYDFVTENPDECNLRQIIELQGLNQTDFTESPNLFKNFELLTPSQFAMALDTVVKEGPVYTFYDGNLIRRFYRKAPCFYVNPEQGISYPTYCPNAYSIKSGLLNNQELLPVIKALFRDYVPEQKPDLTLDVPYESESVLAYVCIPILQRPIPIGMETAEEQLEIQEDAAVQQEDDIEEEMLCNDKES